MASQTSTRHHGKYGGHLAQTIPLCQMTRQAQVLYLVG